MRADEARAEIRAAQVVAEIAERMRRRAIEMCDKPRPGAIVREVGGKQRLMRVVLVGDDLTLDTLSDAGFVRGEIQDWSRYDIVQDGNTVDEPDVAAAKEMARLDAAGKLP